MTSCQASYDPERLSSLFAIGALLESASSLPIRSGKSELSFLSVS